MSYDDNVESSSDGRRRAPARVDVREAEMLAVARALVTPDSYASIEATLASQISLSKMGPSAMRVLSDTLAKGIVKTLARSGGARPRVRPGTSGNKQQRVFDVRSAPKLSFSPYTFELIRWLTSTPLHARDKSTQFDEKPRTLGDEIVAYLTLRLVEGRRLERIVAACPGLRCNLTWLAFTRPLIRYATDGVEVPSMEKVLATEDRRVVIECLAGDLMRRWSGTTSWDELDVLEADLAVRIGTFERGVLDGFLDAIAATNRWDLATFLIDAAARLLPRGVNTRELAVRAAPRVRAEGATLRARTEARRRSGALFYSLARLGKKRDELALVRFMDDDYEVAQGLLTLWEPLPRDAFTRAENVISALDSLDGLGADADAGKAEAAAKS